MGVASSPHDRGRPLSFFAAALWTIGTTLLLATAVQITEAARPGAEADLVNFTACHVLTHSLVIFAMLRVYAPDASMREVLAIRRAPIFPTFLAAISGAALYPALSRIDELIAHRLPPTDEDVELLDKLLQVGTGGQRLMVLIALVVAMPIGEELFFRGVLYGGLRRGRISSLAVIGTAAFYAISHVAPTPSVGAIVAMGILPSWLRARSGSVVPSLVAHAAFAAVPVIPIVLGRGDADVYPRSWIFGSAALAVVAALLAGALFTRSERALTNRLEDG